MWKLAAALHLTNLGCAGIYLPWVCWCARQPSGSHPMSTPRPHPNSRSIGLVLIIERVWKIASNQSLLHTAFQEISTKWKYPGMDCASFGTPCLLDFVSAAGRLASIHDLGYSWKSHFDIKWSFKFQLDFQIDYCWVVSSLSIYVCDLYQFVYIYVGASPIYVNVCRIFVNLCKFMLDLCQFLKLM